MDAKGELKDEGERSKSDSKPEAASTDSPPAAASASVTAPGDEKGKAAEGKPAEVLEEKAKSHPPVSVDSVADAKAMCHDFEKLLHPLPTPGCREQLVTIEKTAQATLARLDEFSAFVESVRSR